MRSIGLPELLVILVVAGGICLLPAIFYLLTLQRALERCAVQSRTTSPGSVWLMLIPIFDLVYQFIPVGHIARSLRNEFARRSITDVEPEPGKGLGIALGVLNIVSIIPFIGIAAGIAAFICWIMYWVKISDYSGRIALPLLPPTAPMALGD